MSGVLLFVTAALAVMLIAVLAIDYFNNSEEPTPLPLEHRESDESRNSSEPRR